MVRFYLKEHKKYSWIQRDNIFYRYGFGKDSALLESIQSAFAEGVPNLNFLGKQIEKVNGNFCFIVRKDEYVYLGADRTQSFPLLYSVSNEGVAISDSISKLQREGVCKSQPLKESLEEIVSMGVVMGKNTLFEDIYVIEAAQIVRINVNSGEIELCDYFKHDHGDYFAGDEKKLARKLDETLNDVFCRVKENAGERLIVVPLSGGYDSRLVVTSLKQVGVENVLCISYGTYRNKEVQVAEKLAKELGYDWMYVPQTKKEIVQFASSLNFWKYMKDISNGSAIPYLQNFAVYKLKKAGVIPSDAIVMTGNSGDVLEGDQMPECFEEDKDYSRKELLDAIMNKHFRLAGRNGASNSRIREDITVKYLAKKIYSYEEVHNIFEQFNWRERQSQFLFNDGLFYSDFCGLEWFFPLWDIEFVDFWLHVPTKLRYKRKFYYNYVHKEDLETANNPTVYQKMLTMAKRKAYGLLVRFYTIKRMTEYDLKGDRIWHLLNRKEYLEMLKWTGGVGTNSNSAVIWALLQKCFETDVRTISLEIGQEGVFKLK